MTIKHQEYDLALRDHDMLPVIAYGPEQEVWRVISDWGGLYSVSSYGRVKSNAHTTVHSDGKVTTHKSRILKLRLNHKGYLEVGVHIKGVKLQSTIHRLVARHFCIQPTVYDDTINHIDEIKTNNHFSNLAWVSNGFNVEYSQAKRCKLIHDDGRVADVFNFSKFARENGMSSGRVSDLFNGKRAKANGWRLYVEAD